MKCWMPCLRHSTQRPLPFAPEDFRQRGLEEIVGDKPSEKHAAFAHAAVPVDGQLRSSLQAAPPVPAPGRSLVQRHEQHREGFLGRGDSSLPSTKSMMASSG